MKKYLFIALVAFLAVTSASAQLRIKMGKNSPIEKLGRAEIAITNLYVDSVDENKLVEDAIRGMLEKLDPHSSDCYFHCGDVDALAARLQKVIDEDYHSVQYDMAPYDWDKIAKQVIGVYEGLLK